MAAQSDPLANVPPAFKPLQHYIKTAAEHDKRDAVISYYCRLYAMQKGMEIDRKSPDCRAYLQTLMNVLEQAKKLHKDNEAMQNELVGQAHVENYALKLFAHADTDDRAGNFGKNVVKLFYTAGMLMDVMCTFGELTEEIEKSRKYAKWKAAYIHNCLKNGEVPQPGPLDDGEGDIMGGGMPAATGFDGTRPLNNTAGGFTNQDQFPGGYNNAAGISPVPAPRPSPSHQPSGPYAPAAHQPSGPSGPYAPTSHQPSGPYAPAGHQPPPSSQPSHSSPPGGRTPERYQAPPGSGAQLRAEDYTKAMKLCKYASSALQYEDARTAIENLTKAINLLTTGKE